MINLQGRKECTLRVTPIQHHSVILCVLLKKDETQILNHKYITRNKERKKIKSKRYTCFIDIFPAPAPRATGDPVSGEPK